MKKAMLAGLVALVCVSGFMFWQGRKDLEAERSKARELAREVEALREENELLGKARVEPAELQRLRAEQSELARLRNEVTQLRRQLKETAAAQKANAKAVATPKPAQENIAPYESYAATNHAVMAWKQTLVTGGWTVKPGRRVLLFSQPESVSSETGGASQVLVQTRILEIPEEVLAQVGLEGLRSEEKQSAAQALLSPEQAQGALDKLMKTAGVDVLAVPRVVTSDGVAASISIGQTVPLPSGETYLSGPQVNLLPKLSPDGTSLDLSVSSQLNIPNQAQAPQ